MWGPEASANGAFVDEVDGVDDVDEVDEEGFVDEVDGGKTKAAPASAAF